MLSRPVSSPRGEGGSAKKRHTEEPYAFLNASLATPEDRSRNDTILKVLHELKIHVYAPQIQLPVDGPAKPKDILEANRRAIEHAAFIVSVLDNPGYGVAYELGIAAALRIPLFAIRTRTEDIGKILEGVWVSLPMSSRATDLGELRTRLERFVSNTKRLRRS